MQEPITILIADDYEITRQGIRNFIEQVPDMKVVGEAQNGDEVKQMVACYKPQILLLDLVMPNHSPVEFERWVRANYPETITLVLTAHDRDSYLAGMLDAGAVGYLDKKLRAGQLSLVYDSLQNIDNALNGKLKSLVGGASFWLEKQNVNDGQYHGVTHLDGSGIDFYTLNDDILRQMNIYHEVGHLLDNVSGLKDAFTNEVAGQVFRDDAGNYLFGGRGVGEISYSTLKQPRVFDPNYGTAAALQHASTDPSEQWADMFANYVAGNIQTEGGGGMMLSAVEVYLIRHANLLAP